MSEHEENKMVNYRLDKLEEAILKLSSLADLVSRWDALFQQQGGVMNCQLHQRRMDIVEKKLEIVEALVKSTDKIVVQVDQHKDKFVVVEADVADLKRFVYKMTGALVVISIAIQLLGPLTIEHFTKHGTQSPAPYSVNNSGTNVWTN